MKIVYALSSLCPRLCGCMHTFVSLGKQTQQIPVSVYISGHCYAMPCIYHIHMVLWTCTMWRVAEAEAQARPTSSISQCVIFFFFCVMKYGIFALCCCLFFIDMLLRDGIILVGLEDPLRLAPTESCGGRGYGILCVMHRPHYNLAVAILLCVVCAQIFASQS